MDAGGSVNTDGLTVLAFVALGTLSGEAAAVALWVAGAVGFPLVGVPMVGGLTGALFGLRVR